ncbi:alpha/beta hydrolase (plasmid) [Rhodococcus sp. USK10]|uniref:alpha/beta fold hydrolase n=1 Tax=Rhodococcus sp. USK10 TaxID=2789739 RepID=UPI001C5F9283|nr:alpha/beta hydrolase [Rhodococcus sp. USK10]QYB00181.1 alpha/beta hydrolase [Rhodococcus sp. USK10]
MKCRSSCQVVLVHGNPETADVWAALIGSLPDRDVSCLSPPGFGCPLPAGFACTMDGYRDWLIAQLERIGAQVHLVGHDWGGLHVINAVSARPDLVLSWASDTAGMFAPGYRWHKSAAQWQQPGVGEQHTSSIFGGDPDRLSDFLAAKGMPAHWAALMAERQDPALPAAVLSLYRSARQPVLSDAGAKLAPLPAAGLVINPLRDPNTGTDLMRRQVAQRCGAEVVTFPDLGHWWMLEDPSRAAQAFETFWSTAELDR